MSPNIITVPPERVLDLEMPINIVNARTVREYLKALLATLWEQGAQFDGKRPWGLSGWRAPIEEALIVAQLVDGQLDADGYVAWCDDREVNSLIRAAIEAL